MSDAQRPGLLWLTIRATPPRLGWSCIRKQALSACFLMQLHLMSVCILP